MNRRLEGALRARIDADCHRLAALPTAELLEVLPKLSRWQLVRFHHLYGIDESREPERLARALSLDIRVHELLPLLLWPKLYAEPPPPLLLSACMSTMTKSVDLGIRREDGVGLWHPLDFMQDDIDVGEELERFGNRKRLNGTVVPGEMRIRAA